MTQPIKTLALTLALSTTFALSANAQTVTPVDTVEANNTYTFHFNEGDLSPTYTNANPKLFDNLAPAVSVTETVVSVDLTDTPYADQFPEARFRAVEYTITNNMIGWNITEFGVTNPGFGTTPFVDPSLSCEITIGDCWTAIGFDPYDLSEFESEEFINSLFGEDNVLHYYFFDSAESPMGDGPAPFDASTTGIVAGAMMGGFYFADGYAASNLIGFATNAEGQSLTFSTNTRQTVAVSAVPIPAGALLLSTGLLGLGALRKKRA